MVFDIMGKLFSRISILEKDATGESMARCLSNTPEFVKTVVNRAVITNPDILVSNKISIEKSGVDTDKDNFNPIYISLADNINSAIVDRMAINVDYKNSHGGGIATIIVIPDAIFISSDITKITEIVMKMYMNILELDMNLKFDPSIKLLNYITNNNIKIPSYDIICLLSCLCYVKATLAEISIGIDTNKFIDIIDKGSLKPDVRSKLAKILKKYNNMQSIKKGLSVGSILADMIS